MEEDHRVSRSEVILDGPADGVSTLVTQIDGDSDLALGAGGRGGDEGKARGGRLKGDGGRRVVGRMLMFQGIHAGEGARTTRNGSSVATAGGVGKG